MAMPGPRLAFIRTGITSMVPWLVVSRRESELPGPLVAALLVVQKTDEPGRRAPRFSCLWTLDEAYGDVRVAGEGGAGH